MNKTQIILFAVVLGLLAVQNPAAHSESAKVIEITVQRFKYEPNQIALKKGVPAVLKFKTLDRLHGFSCPGLNIRSDIKPGAGGTVNVTPQKAGKFPFHCDNFCGTGHEGMTGTITVSD